MRKTSWILAAAVTVVGAKGFAAELERSSREQVCRASQALVAAQLPEGWAWQRGEKRVASNVSGLVASALADAAGTCGTRDAVVRYAEVCVQRHARGDFLYDPDVEALAKAAALTGNANYLSVAKDAFARRYEFANGEEIVERWFMIKRDRRLIGFEAAAAIRAALAVGETAKAEEIALATAKVQRRWVEGWDPRGFLTTSRGAMLEAIGMLSPSAQGKLAAFKRDLVHHLLLTQASDGSWEGRNTQSTAYAVRGLLASGDESAMASGQLGARWLRLTQLTDGSWATFNDRLPEPFVGEVVHEITAEVLLAFR